MLTVEDGRTALFHYTGTLDDGEVFDSSRNRDPIELHIGADQVIPGFESGIKGMTEGETRTFTVSPEDAFGEHDESLTSQVEKERFAEPEGIRVGRVCEVPMGEGHSMPGTVVEVEGDDVLIDFNHPLAGKELTFEVECLEIKDD